LLMFFTSPFLQKFDPLVDPASINEAYPIATGLDG
jgi:hypothetical protein